MVGRKAEREVVEDALSDVRAGSAAYVAVVGEPGIGKTRLLDEAARRAESLGWLAPRGRGSEVDQHVPFALVVDAIDPHLGDLGSCRVGLLGEDRRAELAAVLPSLRGDLAVPGLETQADRYRFHFACRALLSGLAEDQPLALVLDDVHWGDEASLELLAHLLRSRLSGPLLLLLAYRPVYAPQLLINSVNAISRDGPLRLIELGPLNQGEADELLGGGVAPSRRRLLYEDSGGNPFYLEQLARAPIDRGAGRPFLENAAAGGFDAAVPAMVRASLGQELLSLSSTARTLLQGAAVAGEPFELDLAIDIARLDRQMGLAALDELQSRELVRATEDPPRFQFRHPIVRRAVYESAGNGWRLAAHERAVTVLAGRGLPPTVQAYHVERSGRKGDEHAVAVLREAGEAAALRAPATAAGWYRAALRLLPDRADAERRPDLLVQLARALAAAGRLEEARSALTQALELLAPDAHRPRGQIVAVLAQTEVFLGRPLEARTLLLNTLEKCELGSAERVALTLELALDHLRGSDDEGSAAWAEETLVGARALNDRAIEGCAAAILAVVRLERGEPGPARASMADAERLLGGLSDRELAPRLVALCLLALAESGVAQPATALRHAERGIAICRATGQAYLFVPLTVLAGMARAWLGRLDAAAGDAQAALEAARVLAVDQFVTWSATLSSWVAGQRGDIAAAVEAGECAAAVSRQSTPAALSYLAHCVLAEAYLRAGQPERAREEILRNAGGAQLGRIGVGHRARWYAVLVEAELRLGRVEAAEVWVRRAELAVSEARLPGSEAALDEARAAVHLMRQQPSQAVTLALAAVQTMETFGLRVAAGRARALAGRAFAAAGDSTRGQEELQRAQVELEACGAVGEQRDVAGDVRTLALTPREGEVAALLAEGRTNQDIAGQLLLTERTVERHLSRVFAKLGVSGREGVADKITHIDAPD